MNPAHQVFRAVEAPHLAKVNALPFLDHQDASLGLECGCEVCVRRKVENPAKERVDRGGCNHPCLELGANYLMPGKRAMGGTVQEAGFAAAPCTNKNARCEPAGVPVFKGLFQASHLSITTHEEPSVLDGGEPEQGTIDRWQFTLRCR